MGRLGRYPVRNSAGGFHVKAGADSAMHNPSIDWHGHGYILESGPDGCTHVLSHV